MAVLKGISRGPRGLSLTNGIMIDTVRGVLRVRKWPRKRGTPKSALQRWWNDWFKQANLLAKYASAMDQERAIHHSKNSGFYPRDIILKAMRGRLYWWTTPDGWKWYPVAAIGDISDTLDVLAQAVGSVLVRATDRWRAPAPGAVADVLTYQGPANPPIWAPAGGGGGGGQVVLPGTPIAFDGTQTFYDFNVEDYASIVFMKDNVSFSAPSQILIRLSTDGGITYRAGATDYYSFILTPTVANGVLGTALPFSSATTSSTQWGEQWLNNLRAGRVACTGDARHGPSVGAHRSGHALFLGPITHVRLLTSPVASFNAGDLHVTATLG